jgi:hypothetical protein
MRFAPGSRPVRADGRRLAFGPGDLLVLSRPGLYNYLEYE